MEEGDIVMENEDNFLRLMMNYDAHEIDNNDIYDAVEHGDITPEQYEQITGLEYRY